MKQKKPYHVIDDGIRPLVDALNAIDGVKTVASCEGHFTLGKTPYVYFSADPDFARTLEKVLRDAPEQGVKHAGWNVQGVFNQDYRLVFILRAASYEMEAWSLAGQLYRLLFRRRIDADIRCITALTERAGLHHLRDEIRQQLHENSQHDKSNTPVMEIEL